MSTPFDPEPVRDPGERWRDRALCREADPDAFFPTRPETSIPAKRVCVRCPVRDNCEAWAATQSGDPGVAGGHTNRERGARRGHATKAAARAAR